MSSRQRMTCAVIVLAGNAGARLLLSGHGCGFSGSRPAAANSDYALIMGSAAGVLRITVVGNCELKRGRVYQRWQPERTAGVRSRAVEIAHAAKRR